MMRTLPHVRWLLAALWAALALLVFVVADGGSLRAWVALVVTGVIPPLILLILWNDGPPATVAELLHATEQRR